MFKAFIRKYFVPFAEAVGKFVNRRGCSEATIITLNNADRQAQNIDFKLNYYVPELRISYVNAKRIPIKYYFSFKPVIILGLKYKLWHRVFFHMFNMDIFLNPTEAWSWHRLAEYISPIQDSVATTSKKRFCEYVLKLRQLNLSKCYLFGTGPSLGRACERDWSDGYRVACNTIVKSDKLWDHIKPHFIVAGDAIHHFSHTEYAESFRKDLKKRLEYSDVMFLYPDLFHKFVLREFKGFEDKLCPVPKSHLQTIAIDLTKNFVKAANENILTMLQFPVAYTMSDEIYFLGYDGRGKKDDMFWQSSDEYNYIGLMPGLHKAFPAFFDYYVLSKKDKFAYVKKVHGDFLDSEFEKLENKGYKLITLHKSNTPTFQKRYKGGFFTDDDFTKN